MAHFSGTATYEITFTIPAANYSSHSSTRYLLNLGRVENVAAVTVNSQHLGLSWLPPYETDIASAVGPGINTLQVNVTNLWPNRLIGDETLPVEAVYNSTLQDFVIEEWPEWYLQGMEDMALDGGDLWVDSMPRKPGE